jgi:hypothetical protein
VESLVGLAALVPAFLALWYLSGWLDAESAAQQSARVVALTSDVGRAARAEAVLADIARLRDPLSGRPWLHDARPTLVSAERVALDDWAARAESTAWHATAPARALGNGDDALAPRDPRRARVALRLDLAEPGRGLHGLSHLDLEGRLVLDSRDLAAREPEQARARVAGFLPTRLLQPVDLLLRPVRLVASPLEPRLRALCIGRVAPDVLPADRLRPAPPAGRLRTGEPC